MHAQGGPASSDHTAVSQADSLFAGLALSEQPSRFDPLILEGIESLIQGFMGGLSSYTSRERDTVSLRKVQQVAFRRFLEVSLPNITIWRTIYAYDLLALLCLKISREPLSSNEHRLSVFTGQLALFYDFPLFVILAYQTSVSLVPL